MKKQDYKYLFWSFRFTESKIDFDTLKKKLGVFKRWRFQLEQGEGGIKHYQGVFHCTVRSRKTELQKIFKEVDVSKNTVDYLKQSGSKAADAYVMKDESRLEGPWEYNMPREIKVITPGTGGRQWQLDILKTIDEEPDDRTIWWYWSEGGNVGKTAFAKYLVVKHNACILQGKRDNILNGLMTYKTEHGETPRLVIFPVSRSVEDKYMCYEALEHVKDMLFYSGKYEGGTIAGNCPHLIVFANREPDRFKLSQDRWECDGKSSVIKID
jgi:hypothetical protein